MTPYSLRHWDSDKFKSISFLLLAVLIWGIQPFVLKIVLHFFSVPFTAFIRSFVAAILFGALMAGMKARPPNANTPPKPAPRSIAVWLLVGGIGLGVSNLFWNTSLLLTTVGATSVLQLSSSVVLALYGILLLSERCTAIRAAGLILSLCGMFLVTWNGQSLGALGSSHAFRGNIFGICAGLGWGICAIAQKVAVRERPGTKVVAPMFFISSMVLLFPAVSKPWLLAPFNLPMFGLMLITGILGMGIGNFLFTQSMRTIPASIAAAALPVCPLISLTCGTLFLHEPVTSYLLIGGPLTSAGVAVAFLSMSEPGGSESTQAETGEQAAERI